MNKPTKIIVHHTGGTLRNPRAKTSHHTVSDIDKAHARRWPGFVSRVFKNKNGRPYHVGYHVVIDIDGNATQTRAYGEEGAHTIGMNNSSVGVCVTGNFNVEHPTKAQTDAFIRLYKRLTKTFPHLRPEDVEPHRHFASTECFGSNLPDDFYQKLVTPQTSEERRATMLQTIERLRKLIALLQSMLLKKQSHREI